MTKLELFGPVHQHLVQKKRQSFWAEELTCLVYTTLSNVWTLYLEHFLCCYCLSTMTCFDLVLRCKSLWMKASAKWLNVNVRTHLHGQTWRWSSLFYGGALLLQEVEILSGQLDFPVGQVFIQIYLILVQGSERSCMG